MFHSLKQKAATLPPAYFALVMATGTLSIGLNQLGLRLAANILLYMNIGFYLVLVILFVFRLMKDFSEILSDLTSHEKGPGFFTIIAATCILGSQLVSVAGYHFVPFILWFTGILLWLLIMYAFFFAVTTRDNKPELKEGLNGAWLIAAVATQSLSILGTLLSPYAGEDRTIMLFFSLSMYLLGCMLYLNIIALIFYRLTFLNFNLRELTPPYWTNMGAVAIAALAGSTLILNSRYWPFLEEILPFLKGFTLFFWITGTWWIPLLFILMFWRLIYHRVPIEYNAQYWSMVFPLAMYTTSTLQLSKALKFPFLFIVPNIFMYIAFATWIFGLGLFVRHLFSHSS